MLRDSVESIYVRQFFVARTHRRLGLGTEAFRYAIQNITPLGQRIVLDVQASNPAGQRFWESLGFLAQHTEYHLNE